MINYGMVSKIAINIPDCHIPAIDEVSWEILTKIGGDIESDFSVDEVNIMGDFIDLYALSLHTKMPSCNDIKESIEDELSQATKKLKQLRQIFPNAKIRYLFGNHENRFDRIVTLKLPELFGLVTLDKLLGLDKLEIEHTPYGKNQLVSCLGTGLMLRHAPWNCGKHCAAGSLHQKMVSLAFGHTHRLQSYNARTATGETISCYSMGWLGDRKNPIFDYMDHNNWSQAFQVVTSIKKEFFVNTVEIKNHKAVYNNHVYEG
jgi:hypothetical protein